MNAIEMAMKMEQEAVDFYTQCAGKTDNPIGKSMFLSIAEDEKNHIACALDLQKGRPVTPAEVTPLEDMKRIFDRHRQDMLKKVPSTADELEAFKVAMKMEEEAVAFYKKASSQAATAEEKNLFDCLIKDEEEHFSIFQNTYSFLSDTGNWFMWEDHSIVEG